MANIQRDVLRVLMVTGALFALTVFVAGCGDDNDPTQTGQGAPAGASGEAAGGFAEEAGKQRDPEDVAEEKENFSQEPPPIQLQSGDKSDLKVDEPTAEFARSKKEVNALIKDVGIRRSEVAPVDFKTRQVVLVQMPSEPKGTLMQVKDISVQGDTIVVEVARLLSGDGCPTTDYKPNPFNLVETRKMTESKSKVEVEDVKGSPC